jgi:CheY-like chemotaxis protein
MTTVLAVDDDEGVLELVADLLEDEGIHVLRATSGHEALAVLAGGKEIDLLFTDVVMPRMDGFELAREVQRRNPALPVSFTSGHILNEDAQLPGRGNLLRKPWRRVDLAGFIRDRLASRQKSDTQH